MIKGQQLKQQNPPVIEDERNNSNSTSKDEIIRDYAKTTMDEILGWYGLDQIDDDNRQINGLNLGTNVICGKDKVLGVGEEEKVNCSKWMEKESDDNCDHKPHSSPNDDTNCQSTHQLNEDSMCLSGTSSVPGCSNSAATGGDEDSSGNIVCAWCQKIGKTFSLKTGLKSFCSELCFAQCRRASFKKNKVCDWCKHVRHTVNYVDFQSGQQSLQFCSDKCLNQYKMNIFCRETQAHLNKFSAVYRSPSPPSSFFSFNNYNRSTATNDSSSENDKDDSKETEIPSISTPDFWLRNPSFRQLTPSSTSSHSVSSLSSSPQRSSSPLLTSTLESLSLPSSSSTSLSQPKTFHCPSSDKNSKAIDLKPSLSTDTFRPEETSRNAKSLTKKPPKSKKANSREKSHKSKPDLKSVNCITTKQFGNKNHRKLNNQENILDSLKKAIGNTNESSNANSFTYGSSSSNNLASFTSRIPTNQPINQQVEDKQSAPPSVNCPPTFTNLPNHCLPNPLMRIPHFPHSPHHPFLPPFRADFPHLRQPHPMPFPFNQSNLFRLPPGHRPPFPVHHLPFPCHPHLPDHHPPQSPIPIHFQQSSLPVMGQSLPNNSPNYSGPFPVSHPFLVPLPMPLPLPIPFPIKFNSSSADLKSVISTEDKEVQVGFTEQLLSQFTCCNSRKINDVDLSKAKINVSERENQTRFRIDTLIDKLIDKRMSESTDDQEVTIIHSNFPSIDLKRTKIEQSPESGPNSVNEESRVSSHDYLDSRPSCFRKAKRFKRDILSN